MILLLVVILLISLIQVKQIHSRNQIIQKAILLQLRNSSSKINKRHNSKEQIQLLDSLECLHLVWLHLNLVIIHYKVSLEQHNILKWFLNKKEPLLFHNKYKKEIIINEIPYQVNKSKLIENGFKISKDARTLDMIVDEVSKQVRSK